MRGLESKIDSSKPIRGCAMGKLYPSLNVYCSKVEEVWFCAAADEGDRILASAFSLEGQRRALRQTLEEFEGWNIHLEEQPSKEIGSALLALNRIWQGEVVDSQPRLAMERFTPFNRRVLELVKSIPRGSVSTYRMVAAAAGCPGAARAVGNAMAANPFMLLVPCHRVVKTDLTIGGYGSGVNVKERLLRREGVIFRQRPSGRLRVEARCVYRF